MDAADLAFAGAARRVGLIRSREVSAREIEAALGWPDRRPEGAR